MNFSIKYLGLALCLTVAACHKEKPVEEPIRDHSLALQTLDKNLYIPWGLGYLPNGDLLFTERNGGFNLLKKGASAHITLATRAVNTNGEGGLLSLAIDPLYATNHFVYVYETKGNDNRVVRLKYENEVLTEDQVILSGIPEANNHDGGALKFGPDGYLYVGTGDAQTPSKAQDKSSLSGKILRIDRDGNAAPGNPFNSRIWSYGHRNVQGFAWTSAGTLLATEHGPSGENGWCCHDEINLIQPGKNYGWPLTYAGQEKDSLTPALMHSGQDTWAPSGCTYLPAGAIWPNCLVVATLRGQCLQRFYLNVSGTQIVNRTDTLKNQLNRIRTVTLSPDGALVFSSSNSGNAAALLPEDDKIFRLYRK
jgi:glucose/arabinose dehydrogenase